MRARLLTLLRPGAAAAAAAGLGLAIWTKRDAVAAFDWTVSWWMLALAVLLFAAVPLVQAVAFCLVLRALGARPPMREGVLVWTRGFILRYAPTGALGYAYRARARERLNATAAQVWVASAYEQLVALIAGAIVAAGAFLLATGAAPLAPVVAAAAAVAIGVALRPRFAGRFVRPILRRRGIEAPEPLRGRTLAALVAFNALAWIPAGAGTWLVVHALAGGETPSALWLTGAYATAWLLGFLVPLLPAGLGVRDATFASFLSAALPGGVATALALGLRLVGIAGELLCAGVVELAYLAGASRSRKSSIVSRTPWSSGVSGA